MKQIDAERALNLFALQYTRFLKYPQKRKHILESAETLVKIIVRDKKMVQIAKTNAQHHLERMKGMWIP